MTGPEIRRARKALKLSRRAFAERFHLPAGTLHGWELERYSIPAAAQTLLLLIAREPETIARILAADSDTSR